jgi:ferritin heavy chain
LAGFSKYFSKKSEEEREHAKKFMNYMNKRGGRIILARIARPEKHNWGSGLDGLKASLELEKKTIRSLLDLHKIATVHEDNELTDFLEIEFLQEQIKTIKELGDRVSELERAQSGLGEYVYDLQLKY